MLKLEIVTPEKKVIDADVDTVTIPTATGEIGVLPNHAPLISALKPGILSYANRDASEKLVVAGGFVEINSDSVSVLTDVAERPEEIDREAARAGRESAEKSLAGMTTTALEETQIHREQLDHAEARLQLVGK